MTTSIAGKDETRAAENNDVPAPSITTGMLGVGIVPFVARTERDQVQGGPRRDYDALVDLVRTEMAQPSR